MRGKSNEGGKSMDYLVTIPDVKFIKDTDKILLYSRLKTAVTDVIHEHYLKNAEIEIKPVKRQSESEKPSTKNSDEDSDENITELLKAQEPYYTFDQIVLDDKTIEELQYSIKFSEVQDKVYNQWNLKKIEPSPKLALNFWGESGTGKTMAAHAMARKMGKKIILASYAEIESKYHGDGPKNVKKLFSLASEQEAVLFIDEADSLLSKRLTNVTQGSEQAINSMRSQLLIEIEKYSGVVIFATNLAQNYDEAFVTRIRSIRFQKPDENLRKKLWQIMLLPELPLDSAINVDELAKIEDVVGRDIKNAVVKSAIKVAVNNTDVITQEVIVETVKDIVASNLLVTRKLSSEEKRNMSDRIIRERKKERMRQKVHRIS
jgi:ATP-dependent 26S proteasome regulatory subunit